MNNVSKSTIKNDYGREIGYLKDAFDKFLEHSAERERRFDQKLEKLSDKLDNRVTKSFADYIPLLTFIFVIGGAVTSNIYDRMNHTERGLFLAIESAREISEIRHQGLKERYANLEEIIENSIIKYNDFR